MDAEKKPADKTENKEVASAAAPPDGGADKAALEKPTDKDPKTDAGSITESSDDEPATPPKTTFKDTLKRFRVYLLAAVLLALIGGVFGVVSSLNGRKTPPAPSVQSQTISENQLKQLAKSGTATSGQTLTVQGNSVITGQALLKSGLYVAGDVQSAGGLNIPGLTGSNTATFGSAQTGTLQVAKSAAFQGAVAMQNGLTLSGPVLLNTASIGTLTATVIIMNPSGQGQIQVPHHVAFTGAFPGRTISFGVLGNGGSASINGSDTSGTVSINTGNNPVAGCFVTVIFDIPFAHPPNILLGPVGMGAGAITRYTKLVTDANGNTTAFRICTNDTPLPNQAFGFSYFINDAPN